MSATEAKFGLHLSETQRQALVRLARPRPELGGRLRLAAVEGDDLVCGLSWPQLEDLDAILAEADAKGNEPLLAPVADQVRRLISAHAPHLPTTADPRRAREAAMGLALAVFQGRFPSEAPQPEPGSEAAIAHLPLDALGGLSAYGFSWLISDDWARPDGLVRLNRQCPAPRQAPPLAQKALRLLEAVAARGSVEADHLGRLPASLVMILTRDPLWGAPAARLIWEGAGSPGEDRLAQLKAVRRSLETAGMLALAGGRFRVTPLGNDVLARGIDGLLLAGLIAARLQHGAGQPHSGRPGAVLFQRAMGYHLLRLRGLGPTEARTAPEMARQVLLPPEFYQAPGHKPPDTIELLRRRLLEPALELGLMMPDGEPDRFQTTLLLARMVRIEK